MRIKRGGGRGGEGMRDQGRVGREKGEGVGEEGGRSGTKQKRGQRRGGGGEEVGRGDVARMGIHMKVSKEGGR